MHAVTVAQSSSRKLDPVHIRACVCFVNRKQDRIKITLSTDSLPGVLFIPPREDMEQRHVSERVHRIETPHFVFSNLNGTKQKMASSLLCDDESFDEKWASVLACCLCLSIGIWRIAASPIRELRHNIDFNNNFQVVFVFF
jgi:hypothetical protein